MNTTIFITYSWDSQDHKDWVRGLADSLIENGINVLLDQYDIKSGQSFTQFMEQAIDDSDKVIVVLTPSYRIKSSERKGGVGYEQQIISGEIISGVVRSKFIPLIREGQYEDGDNCAIPPHFKGVSTLDFRDSANREESLELLIREIYNEPKHSKPQLGTKPDFGKINAKRNLYIHLSQDFECLQSEAYLTDLLIKIYDLRVEGREYKLDFRIDVLSDRYEKYVELSSKHNLSDDELKEKIILRDELNSSFFFKNGNLYEYLNFSINIILDFSFKKFKYIYNYNELFTSVTQSLRLFSESNNWIPGTTKFDVFNNELGASFSIWITEAEVELLLSKFSTKDRMFLTAIAGLDVYDLEHHTLISKVIPKNVYKFTIDFFQERVKNEQKEDYCRIGNWRIGLG